MAPVRPGRAATRDLPRRAGRDAAVRAVLPAVLRAAALFAALALAGIACFGAQAWWHGRQSLRAPPPAAADAVLVLGNRAWIGGAPNPCLVARVEAGVAIARAGLAPRLLMSGGPDREDGRIEAVEMEGFARAAGFGGPVLREPAAQSTRENLLLSWPLLAQAGARRVIVVSEPGHLWRARRLARRSGFERAFDTQYAVAPCRRPPARALRAALREPLAILANAANGWL